MHRPALLSIALLVGCAPVIYPTIEPETSTDTLAAPVQQGTPALWDQLYDEAARTGRTHVALVERGDDALALRINLIRSARHSVKILTFIWEDCEAVRLAEWELARAATQRGVEARLVSDALNSDPDVEHRVWELAGTAHVQHRVFAPIEHRLHYSRRDLIRAMFHDFRRVDDRMHTKLMIIDDRVALTGGRNWGNEYFDQNLGLNFRDRDVLVVGPAVADAVAGFDTFWQDDRVVPSRALDDVADALAHHAWHDRHTRADFRLNHLFGRIEADADDPDYIRRTFVDPGFDVERVEWVIDHPGKGEDGPTRLAATTRRFGELTDAAEREILIQSPYLVLTDETVEHLRQRRLAKPKLRVAISTNSLANTDHEYAYSAVYKQTRKHLVDTGFEVFLMRPIPRDIRAMMAYSALLERKATPAEAADLHVPRFGYDRPPHDDHGPWLNPYTGTPPYLAIHAKSAVIDESVAIVGSFNYDPRSAFLNTEIGLVVHDPRFARRLAEHIGRDMAPANSYVLGPHDGPPFVADANQVPHRFFEWFVFDLWPFRHGGVYALRDGCEPVPYHHEQFHENYRAVGDFPEVRLSSGAVMRVWFFKTIGNLIKPEL